MNILALSDIHGDVRRIDQIAEPLKRADLVILAGDITNFAGAEKISQILDVLERYTSAILGVHGNCDLPAVEEVLNNRGVSLNGRCVDVGGIQFAGVGGSEPSLAPNKVGESAFEKAIQRIKPAIKAGRTLVLVTHQPPVGTKIDAFSQNRHTGSRTVRRFIEQVQPILAISGHIHEARGIDKLDKTTLVNPGPFCKGFYAVVEIKNQAAKADLHCTE